MQTLRLGVVSVIAFTLSSCLDLTFHTMVKDNGSGTIKVEVLLDESVGELYVKNKESGEDDGHGDLHGVKITKTEEGVDKDGRYFIRLQGEFDSFEGLSEEELSYRIERKNNQTTYRIRFVSDRNQASGDDDAMALQMMNMMFGDRKVQYSLSVPGRIINHNAAKQDGQTLTWNISFVDWLQHGLTMEVTTSR